MDHSALFCVLVIEDEPNTRSVLANKLEPEADAIETSAGVDEAMVRFSAKKHAMVIIDLQRYGNFTGIDLLKWILQSHPQTAVIMISAHGTVEIAVDAMKAGAFDYISKPVDFFHLIRQVRKARKRYQLQCENQATAEHRTISFENGRKGMSLAETMDAFEKNTIKLALEACNLHRENTAKMLGISVRSLHYKMKQYGLH